MVVVNGLVFALQTYYFVSDPLRYRELRTFWIASEWFFTLLWTLECGAKMGVMGARGYFAKFTNTFDFIVTLLALVRFITHTHTHTHTHLALNIEINIERFLIHAYL